LATGIPLDAKGPVRYTSTGMKMSFAPAAAPARIALETTIAKRPGKAWRIL
jgi:hypothetical protein